MTNYIDSSVILRYLLQHSGHIEITDLVGKFVTSELSYLECRRTLIRYRLNNEINDQGLVDLFEQLNELMFRISLLALNSTILAEASQNWGVTLGSLDSIHLATALFHRKQSGEPVQLLTHDKSLSIAARLSELVVLGVSV